MKERLGQNFALKMISLALAFVIWLMVVNISQPEVTAYQTVEIKVKNADRLTSADKTYTMNTRTVRVSYRVRLPQQSRISADDFEAYVDLADYSITGAVPVYVDVDDSASGLISGVSLNPMVVHVDTEDIQRKRFDITTSTNGRTADGYMAGEMSISPDYVYVTGPVSEVGQISSVGIDVNIADVSSAQSGTAEVKYYDANGNEIRLDDRISLNRGEISYELPVYRIKSLSVIAEAEGTPAEGYVLDSVEVSPGFVDVYGDEAVLSQYASIHVPASEMMINGASQTVSRSVDITGYLPEGLRLAQPGTEVTVAARIKKLPETTTAGTEESAEGSEVEINASEEAETKTQETAHSRTDAAGESKTQESTAAHTGSAHQTAEASGTGTEETEQAD